MVHTWYYSPDPFRPKEFPDDWHDDTKYYFEGCSDRWCGYKGQPICIFSHPGQHKNFFIKLMKLVNSIVGNEVYTMSVKLGGYQTFRSKEIMVFSYYHPQKHFKLSESEFEKFKQYFNIVECKEHPEKSIVHHTVNE